MMSTFGTFTMARLGIYASQYALNVTGNNISNINTEGYSRQVVDQSAMSFGNGDRYITKFSARENGGVLATGVNQLRDQYLDIRYRSEMTKVGEADAKLGGLNQLAEIFDEVGKGEDEAGVLEARFNDLRQQIETLHSQGIGKNDIDNIVRSSAESLAIQFNDYAKKLDELELTLNKQFDDDVDTVNTTLEKIRSLNEAIRKTQVFGGEALIQKDERNLLIDELSSHLGINVTYEMEDLGEGLQVEKLKIATSGDPSRVLIDGIYGARVEVLNRSNYDLGISELRDSRGFLDPSQPNKIDGKYYSTTAVGSESDWNTIEGFKESVKRLPGVTNGTQAKEYEDALNAQFGFTRDESNPKAPYYHVSPDGSGGYVVHFHDDTTAADPLAKFKYVNVSETPVAKVGDTELSGSLQALRELLTEAGEYADDETIRDVDPDAGSKRGVPYYRKALDTLASVFAKAMNEANKLSFKDIFSANKGTDGEFNDGDKLSDYTWKDDDFKRYFTNADTAATFSELKWNDDYKAYFGGDLFAASGEQNPTETKITAANLSISYGWAHGSTRVLRSREADAPETSQKSDNLAHFVAMLGAKHDFTTGAENLGESFGTTYFTGTFQEMLTDTIAGTLAKDQNITGTMLGNYTTQADELYVSRDSVMGVDLNDEAMNMMQFQKAYAAACRLMTTYDGMLDKLINGTAV